MSVIGTLAVKIVGDSSNLDKNLKKTSGDLKKFAKGAAAAVAAATTAFAAMTKKTINTMDSMSKMAQSAGVSVEALSRLGFAAELSGSSTEGLATNLVRLTKGMSDAQQGIGEAKKAFDALGMDGGSIKTADEALLQIADKFQNMPDGAEKTAIAYNLFGRAGAKMIPMLNQGRAGLAAMGDELEGFGGVITTEGAQAAEQFNDQLTRLGQVFSGVFIGVANTILPTINKYIEAVFAASKATDSWFTSLTNVALGGVPDTFTEYQKEILETEQAIARLKEEQEAGTMVPGFVDVGALEDRLKMLKAMVKIEQERKESLTNVSAIPPFEPIEISDDSQDKLTEMLETVQKIAGEFEKERETSLEMLNIREKMLGMTDDERKVQESVNEVLDETRAKIDEINKQRLEAANAGANARVLSQFDVEIEKVKELGKEYAGLAETQQRSAIEAQRTFSFGWSTAFNQYAEDASNSAQTAGAMFSSITSNMTSAVNRFVDTGKLSFADFANSVIKDLIRIQLQTQLSQGLNAIIGAVGSAFAGSFGGTGATAMGAGTTAGGAGAVAFPVSLASGGYTGNGGKFEPAGVVHRGEYVLNSGATSRIGVGNLDRMNKGFANGGFVGSSGSTGGGVNINIKNEAGAEGYKATAQARQNTDGGINVDVLVRRAVSADLQSNGALSQQMANTFGLRRNI